MHLPLYHLILTFSPIHPHTHTFSCLSWNTGGWSQPCRKAGAEPSLSVGEEPCETVEQVWVVPRQDRHELSQAFPEGTHLKSFSLYLHSRKKTQKKQPKTQNMHCHTLKPVSQRAHYCPLSSRLLSLILLACCCMRFFFFICTSVFCPLLVCLFLLMAPHLVFVCCWVIVCCLPAASHSAFSHKNGGKKSLTAVLRLY